MVTIIGFKTRENAAGEPFNILVLQGDIEMVQSQQSGKFYATARKTTITSTFDERTCQALIGKTLPGVIEKFACEPYEYVIEESGETIQLSHTYIYKPNAGEVDQPTVQAKAMA